MNLVWGRRYRREMDLNLCPIYIPRPQKVAQYSNDSKFMWNTIWHCLWHWRSFARNKPAIRDVQSFPANSFITGVTRGPEPKEKIAKSRQTWMGCQNFQHSGMSSTVAVNLCIISSTARNLQVRFFFGGGKVTFLLRKGRVEGISCNIFNRFSPKDRQTALPKQKLHE